MTFSREYISTRIRIAFWRAASETTSFALRHRHGLYQALTYAPIAIVALAAFILGRGIGMMVGTGLF
ncbi:MAG: hypothetical protein WBR18_09575 [Anaerolineales bacterium]